MTAVFFQALRFRQPRAHLHSFCRLTAATDVASQGAASSSSSGGAVAATRLPAANAAPWLATAANLWNVQQMAPYAKSELGHCRVGGGRYSAML